jgi:hypothetical protein
LACQLRAGKLLHQPIGTVLFQRAKLFLRFAGAQKHLSAQLIVNRAVPCQATIQDHTFTVVFLDITVLKASASSNFVSSVAKIITRFIIKLHSAKGSRI